METGLKGDMRKQGDKLRYVIHCLVDKDGGGLAFRVNNINGQKEKDPRYTIRSRQNEQNSSIN